MGELACSAEEVNAAVISGANASAGTCLQPTVGRTNKPVNPLFGFKHDHFLDYRDLGKYPLSFTRTYTTHSSSVRMAFSGFAKTPLGYQDMEGKDAQLWLHSYSSLVFFDAQGADNTYCPGKPGYFFAWGKGATTHVRRPDGTVYYFVLAPDTVPANCADRFLPVSGIARTVKLLTSQTRDTLTVTLDSQHQAISASYRVFETDEVEFYSVIPSDLSQMSNKPARLHSITARDGSVTKLVYVTPSTPLGDYIEGNIGAAGLPGSAHLLQSVTSPSGRQLRFVYNSNGHLSQLLLPNAVKDSPAGAATSPIRYAYNAKHSLERVNWQDGTSTRYHYEDKNGSIENPWKVLTSQQLLTGITNKFSLRTDTYRYDNRGRVVEQFGAPGADGVRSYHMSFAYSNDQGLQTTVTDHVARDPSNNSVVRATTHDYRFGMRSAGTASNAPAVPTTTLTAPCTECGATPAAFVGGLYHQPLKLVSHDGTVNFYKYDVKGRAIEVATFTASEAEAWPRPPLNVATSVVSTEWHESWNLPVRVAGPRVITAFTYDGKGRLISQSSTPTSDATGAAKFSAPKAPLKAASNTM